MECGVAKHVIKFCFLLRVVQKVAHVVVKLREREKGQLRKVTQRSFIDCRLLIIDIDLGFKLIIDQVR